MNKMPASMASLQAGRLCHQATGLDVFVFKGRLFMYLKVGYCQCDAAGKPMA